MYRIPFAAVGCSALLVGCPGVAGATSFTFTGSEQTYTVPAGVANLAVTAIGGTGGTPPTGSGLAGGHGATVTGIVAVSPGQVLYVHVAGNGGLGPGGYNGGGAGGVTQEGARSFGGGGASDVRTAPESAGAASVDSRLIVAAGGGGSAGIAAGGGDAGTPGGCCGAAGTGPNTAQPGTQTAGGAGGCGNPPNCGEAGSLGRGGAGGASGLAADQRAGGGGGGGLYGGGGGPGSLANTGGGAGGSSKVPPGGSLSIGPSPAQITIDPSASPPPSPLPTVTPGATPPPTPPPVVAPTLKTMSTTLVYLFFLGHDARTTRLAGVRVKGIPSGSTVTARCLTCKGKRGKARFTKPSRADTAIKAFDRTFPTGTLLEVVISNPAYSSQIKTLRVRKGKAPRVTTRCQLSGAAERTHC